MIFSLRIQQLLFALVLVLTCALAALFEGGSLSQGVLGDNASLTYALDVWCVVVCVVGTYVALRLFSFDRVRRSVRDGGDTAYYRWAGVRTLLVALSLWSEVAIYYLTLQSQTAHYTLFISLVAAIFCIPTARERDGLKSKDDSQ
ncbi:MAG: hypothetical protein IJ786_03885 [Bacteroidaceae bacterium]|nr:hypothetical protein [Bacteroidaceae bacterium]